MSRAATALVLLMASTSLAAVAQGPTTVPVPRLAPAAFFVDGVKVGSDVDARLPKQPVRTSCCSSGCTLMITY